MGCCSSRPSVEHTIRLLEDQERKMMNTIYILEKTRTVVVAKAKQCQQEKNKPRASYYQAIARGLEDQIRKNYQHQLNIVTTMRLLETARTNQEVLKAFREATDTLKTLLKDIPLDQVEELVQTFDDLEQENNDISDLLATPTRDWVPSLSGGGLDGDYVEGEGELEDQIPLVRPSPPPPSETKNPSVVVHGPYPPLETSPMRGTPPQEARSGGLSGSSLSPCAMREACV